MTTASTPEKPRRIAALDAARALGVLAMVCGHTLDALLAPAVRAEPALEAYWRIRGLTAPLFLLVAGWAVTASVTRAPAQGWAILRGRLPRVGLLLLVGYLLRVPGWNLPGLVRGDRELWRHFLAFDALHCIALGLFAGAAVLSASSARRTRLAAFAALTAVTLAAGTVWPVTRARGIGLIALEQAALGTSPFPLLPWVAYFFVGSLVGLLAAGHGARRVAAGLAATGLATIALAMGLGLEDLAVTSPVLFAFRAGQVLVILALLAAVPAALAARAAPIGRASLFVYALHVPLVYGWAQFQGLYQRVGPSLPFLPALGVAIALCAACLAVHAAVQRLRRAAREAGLRLRGGQLTTQ